MKLQNIFKQKKVPIEKLKSRLIQLEMVGYSELSASELHNLVFESE